eukprot:4261892-Pleurochrysis_carterae.AAC.1
MSTSTASAPRSRSERASVLSAVPGPAKTTSTVPTRASAPRGSASCAPPGRAPSARRPAPCSALRASGGRSLATGRAGGLGAPPSFARGPVPGARSAPQGS